MKRIAIAALFSIIGAVTAYAQTELFKVLVNKGKNTADNKPIFAGSKIFEGQTIHVVEGGYLAMIYKNGKSMELKTPGSYKVMDLEKQAIANSGSFSKKYAELVMNEMTKTNEDLTADRKKHMNVTGSVDRGEVEKPALIAPKNSDLLMQQIKIHWTADSSAKEGYVVKIRNMFDEVLKVYTITDTLMTINVPDLELKNNSKMFIVEVTNKNKAKKDTTGRLVKVLDGKKAEELQKEIKMVKQEAGDESALSKIILAAFCEQNKLYLEAINYYKQAIATEPEVEEYKYAYLNFLERHEVRKTTSKK